jgi:hypothetical protein
MGIGAGLAALARRAYRVVRRMGYAALPYKLTPALVEQPGVVAPRRFSSMMQGKSSPTPAEEDARIESGILCLLMDHDEQRPWSFDEVAREVGDRIATTDALARLHAAGLIHRLDGFVFATRAALRADQIAV